MREKYLNFEGCETYFCFSPRYKTCSVDSNITGATWLDRIWACSLCTRLTEGMNSKSDLWGFSDGAVNEVVMQARTLTTYKNETAVLMYKFAFRSKSALSLNPHCDKPHRGGVYLQTCAAWHVYFSLVSASKLLPGMCVISSPEKKKAFHNTSVVLTGNVCSSPMCQFCRKELA